MRKTLYVINPAGHGGSGRRTWNEFQAIWPGSIDPADVIFTEESGHARRIAAEAPAYDVLAVVGGDGTIGEVMSGIMERKASRPVLAMIPAGTGNDFALNLGICSIEEAAEALREGRERAVDLIRLDNENEDGPVSRYAFLFASAGFSSIPMMKPWMKRILGPVVAYYLATFLQILVYRAPLLTIIVDGVEHRGRSWLVVAGNSEKAAGGSMCIAPGASIDDGELNITIFPSKSKFEMVTKLFPKLATGEHVDHPDVSYFTGKRIVIDSVPPAILDLDGDLVGTTPATITVCPGVISVIYNSGPGE